MPSVLDTVIIGVILYNSPFKGRGSLSDEELPYCIIFTFIICLIGSGLRHFIKKKFRDRLKPMPMDNLQQE